MKWQEPYWTFKAPPTPELKDLPEHERTVGFESLSPGARRAIWRESILHEAKVRQLSDETIFRLKVALIDGSLSTLDEYLMVFDSMDAKRAPLPEDRARLDRADLKHHQSEVQITAREEL